MELETTQTTPTKGDLLQQHLEVTGVSRSGRVRKKSSKLMDFQSLDDVELKTKKSKGRGRPSNAVKEQRLKRDSERSQEDDDEEEEEFLMSGGDNEEHSESDLEIMDDEDVEMLDDDGLGAGDEEDGGNAFVDPTVKQSLYMSEKSNKKKILKDGKVVFGKADRKDKGKSRFTAYMLWAKDIRKQLLAKQPDLDFATLSRRISEMWANVPMNERVIWRRRAKSLATKTKKKILRDSMQSTAMATKASATTFINRATTSRTKKLAEAASTTPQKASPKSGPLSPTHHSLTSPGRHQNIVTQPGGYKVTGIEPVDVAAHLRLLGESLSIIGERLMEHEGQITVSGSLSVLMDSLLCSLCPLLCLTTQLPGLDQKSLKDNLHKTLDNIAYVMPGL